MSRPVKCGSRPEVPSFARDRRGRLPRGTGWALAFACAFAMWVCFVAVVEFALGAIELSDQTVDALRRDGCRITVSGDRLGVDCSRPTPTPTVTGQ